MEVSWTKSESEMLFELEGFGSVNVPKKGIYFFGGSDSEMNESNELYRYEEGKMIKLNAPSKPLSGRSNCSLAYFEKESKLFIYVFGGLNQSCGWLNDCWKGEISENTVTWSKIEHENELTPRDKMSIAQNDECCYLIGGFGPVEDVEEDEEDSNEEIKEKADQQGMSMGWFDEIVKFDFSTEKFEEITWTGNEGVAGKAAANAVHYDNNILLFGGRGPTGRTDKLWKFDLKSGEWEEEKPGGFPPAARSFGSHAQYENGFLLFGGSGRSDELLSGLHSFKNGKWAKIEPKETFISSRRQCAIHVIDQQVILFGGVTHVDLEMGNNKVSKEIWMGSLSQKSSNTAQISTDAALQMFGVKRKSDQ